MNIGKAKSGKAELSELPARWKTSVPAIKAVQVAFDVSESVMEAVRKAAFDNNLSTSDQLRVILGLEIVRQAKRPRLTMSLSSADYQTLGKRFQVQAADHLAIKERVFAALVEFANPPSKSKTKKADVQIGKSDANTKARGKR
jgi:hypothetical protein